MRVGEGLALQENFGLSWHQMGDWLRIYTGAGSNTYVGGINIATSK